MVRACGEGSGPGQGSPQRWVSKRGLTTLSPAPAPRALGEPGEGGYHGLNERYPQSVHMSLLREAFFAHVIELKLFR